MGLSSLALDSEFRFSPEAIFLVLGGVWFGLGGGGVRQITPSPPTPGTGNSPSLGQPTPGVVEQDKSSGGSVDTTKTRSDPQRDRMSSGERPVGAAKGKQSILRPCAKPPPPPPPGDKHIPGPEWSVASQGMQRNGSERVLRPVADLSGRCDGAPAPHPSARSRTVKCGHRAAAAGQSAPGASEDCESAANSKTRPSVPRSLGPRIPLQGLTRAEIDEKFPFIDRLRKANKYHFRFPQVCSGGPSHRESSPGKTGGKRKMRNTVHRLRPPTPTAP